MFFTKMSLPVVYDVDVAMDGAHKILKEIVAYEVLVIWAPYTMILARQNHHVETLAVLDERVGKAVADAVAQAARDSGVARI